MIKFAFFPNFRLFFRLFFSLEGLRMPAVLLLAGGLTGCASVEKRIEAHAEVFSTYPEEVRAQLRAGQIALGYDMKMVEIAKGRPDVVNLKRNADGETTVWRYVGRRQFSRAVPVYDSRIRGADWVSVTETDEFERLRVEFRNGEVVSFEELQSGR